VASIFAWTGALRKRGELDSTPEISAFADDLEAAVIDLIESGIVTKDLVSLINPKPDSLETTESFIGKIAKALDTRFAARFSD
jgi:isocitrate dehydrogenase